MKKSEIYKIRYQIYRDLGYTPAEARAKRSHSLDVSPIKLNEEKKVKKNRAYKSIVNSMTGPKDVKKFVNKAWRTKNDTVFSRWGMLTQDERYQDNTQKIRQFIQDDMKISEKQSYYFLYFMTQNKMTYQQTKEEMLTNADFEKYKPKGSVI